MSELKLKWETLNANLDDESAITQFGTLELQVEREPEGWDWCILDDCGSLLAEATVFADCKWAAQQAVEAQLSERLRLASQTLDSSWLEAVKQIGYTINESSFDLTAAYRLIRKNGLTYKGIDWRKGFALREELLEAVTKLPVPPMRGPFFSVLATNSANQEQAAVAEKVVNYMVEEAIRTGDFSNFDPDTQEELPGLKENVERLIEEHLERQHDPARIHRTCIECNEPLTDENYTGLCIQCEMATEPTLQRSGYDQILAQIKREASEVEL